jgi:hypothetical protein
MNWRRTSSLLERTFFSFLTALLRFRSTSKVTLIGFSKGCVVLNQLLHELSTIDCSTVETDLARRIRRFIWLDGGHNNGNRAMIWPIQLSLIKTLKQHEIDTEIFVTPFQIDSRNPSKRQHRLHYDRFIELLSKESIEPVQQIFFNDQPASIEKHFELLDVF